MTRKVGRRRQIDPRSNTTMKLGVRPFKLHAARHTHASLALASGKSVRWAADQPGHASPMLTLKTYAQAMRAEADLSFANFGPSARPDLNGRPSRWQRQSGN